MLIFLWSLDSRMNTITSPRFNCFSRFLKNIDTRKASFYFFSTKQVNTFIFIEGGKALSWYQNNKSSNIILITCFRHYDIFAKTSSRTTTAIAFSSQNVAGSRARSSK